MLKQLMLGFDPTPVDWLGTGLTVLFVGVFAYWAVWAFRPANRAKMEAASRLPFEGGE